MRSPVIRAADEPELVLDVATAARRLHLHPDTVYRLIRQEQLPGVRLGGRVLVPVERLNRLVNGEPA